MFTLWYLSKINERIERKENEYLEQKYRNVDIDPMFGNPPHHWTGSVMGGMEIMLSMLLELEICVVIDLVILTLILKILV